MMIIVVTEKGKQMYLRELIDKLEKIEEDAWNPRVYIKIGNLTKPVEDLEYFEESKDVVESVEIS